MEQYPSASLITPAGRGKKEKQVEKRKHVLDISTSMNVCSLEMQLLQVNMN